jgi:diguanylate cyclase (GGDEF)-like protein
VVTAIQALTLGFLVWNGETQHTQNRLAVQQLQAQEQSSLLANALAPYLIANDHAALRKILDPLKNNHALRYAGVYDTRLELIASLGSPPSLRQNVPDAVRSVFDLVDGMIAIEAPVIMNETAYGIVQLGYAAIGSETWLTEIGIQNAIVAGLALLLTIIVVTALCLPLGRDLVQLEGGLQALNDGEWETRIHASGPMAGLAVKVNQLIKDIQNNRSQLQASYEKRLQESRRLNAMLRDIHATAWEVDPERAQFSYVSDEAERLLGYPLSLWLSPDFIEKYVHPSDQDWLCEYFADPGTDTESFNMDFRVLNSDQEWRWLRMISSVEIREQGPVPVGLLLDSTEEKHNEQHIAYLADHDALTGLINRRRFKERLQDQINYNDRSGASGALLLLDLDRFKFVNSTFGQDIGDEYLRQTSQYLREATDQATVIGRLGGDEFGIILANADTAESAQFSAKLLSSLNTHEFSQGNHRIPFSGSIGIALFPDQGLKASELLTKADAAMYKAKDQGRNSYHLFTEGPDDEGMQAAMQWNQRIRKALKDDNLRLFFQPIVDLRTGAIRHYECLLRLINEDGSISASEEFIATAEYTGLVDEIDRWVINHAFRIQRNNLSTDHPLSLTLNLSGRHLHNPAILDVIRAATKRFKPEPGSIVFEIHSSDVIGNIEKSAPFIKELKNMGHQLSLDHFGDGVISFQDLIELPISYVKIDGSFIRKMFWSTPDRAIVKAVHETADSLEIQTIAETIEDQRALDILRALGVSMGQGYLFAKPTPRFHTLGKVVIAESA